MVAIKNFLFKNTSLRQMILKNTFWLAGGTIISRVTRSIVVIFAARILGTENYGIFTYALSLAALFTIFSDIGLSQILTREIVKRSEKEQLSYASTSLFIKLGLVCAVTLLISAVGPHIAKFEEAKSLMITVACLVAFDSLRSFLYAVIRARNEMQKETVLELVTEVAVTTLCLLALFRFPSAHNLATSYMLGSGIGFLLTFYVVRKYFKNPFTHANRALISPILKSSWPFAVVGVFGVFMTNIDSVIIAMFKPASDLGLYAAAQKMISLLYLLPGFLYTSLSPIMSKLYAEKDEKRMNALIQKALLITIGMVVPIVVGGILLAGPLMNVLYGYAYIESTVTFKVLLLTLIPIFPGMILSSVLFAEDRRRVFITATAVGAAVNVGLDFLLIPSYGVAGSAFATLAAQLALNGIFLNAVRKTHSFVILKRSWKILIAVIPMALLVFGMKSLLWPLFIIIPSAGIVFFGFLYLMKEELISDVMQGFRE